MSVDEAIERLYREVKNSFPAFTLHGLDWDEISERHIPLVRAAPDPVPAMQRWMAELQDAHTWVRPIPPLATFPYDLHAHGDSLRFYRVPPSSTAWKMGVRPGFELVGENLEEWRERTSGNARHKPFVIGARILATPAGQTKNFKAKSPAGEEIEWIEASASDRWLSDGSGTRCLTGV